MGFLINEPLHLNTFYYYIMETTYSLSIMIIDPTIVKIVPLNIFKRLDL